MGWFRKKFATMGGGGFVFSAPQAPRAAKPLKIGPPLGENFFSGKIFIVGKYFRCCFA